MSTSETNQAPEAPNPTSPRKPRAKQSVPISVFLGIMAVPLAAAASMFLVSPQIEEPAALAADSAAAEVAVASVPDLAQDIVVACGPIATEMIELETAGGLTTLQAAALDALRPVCAQAGLPLPQASASHTAQVVLTRSNPVVTGAPASGSDDDEDDSDDSSEDWDDSLDSDDSSEDWDD